MRLPTLVIPDLSKPGAGTTLNNIVKRIVFAINNIQIGAPLSGENVWCDFVTIEASNAHECISATHALSAVPHSTICIWQDTGGVWYKPTDATSADTDTQLFAICTTASSAILMIF